jgi:hypothetical protein
VLELGLDPAHITADRKRLKPWWIVFLAYGKADRPI